MKPEFFAQFTDRQRGPFATFRYTKVSQRQHELLEYGFQSFYWLLPFGATLNATKFADLICTHFSTENPKTAAVVSAFRQLAQQIAE